MQLDLFSEADFIPDEEQIKRDGMVYAVKSICASCSNRGRVKDNLIAGNKQDAFKWFNDSFDTYGFGNRDYGCSMGILRVRNHQFKVTSREMFNVLLEIQGEIFGRAINENGQLQ